MRYDTGDEDDVNLLEVLEGWPGPATDALFHTEFDPNENFLIFGKLKLVLGNPKQWLNAVAVANSTSKSKEAKDIRGLLTTLEQQGEVIFAAKKPDTRVRMARRLQRALGL